MRRTFRNLLWPRYTAADPNIINRAGRVLHWTFTAIVLIMFIPYAMLDSVPLFVTVAISFGALLAGRAIRYILSAE